MDTLEFIYKKFGIDKTAKSPIEVIRSREGAFPKLINNLDFKVGAEIGIATGGFSKHLCKHCPNFKLYAVDAWEVYHESANNETQEDMDQLYRTAKKNLAGFNCHIIRDWSMNVVKRFADESLDFVYVDAAHDYKHVYQDIREWSKKVRKGGIIGGHDYMDPDVLVHKQTRNRAAYSKKLYDVKAAVNDWVKKNAIRPLFVLVKVNCRTWFYVKEYI